MGKSCRPIDPINPVDPVDPTPTPETPGTGDHTNVIVLAFMFIVSLLAVAYTMIRKKKAE